MSMCVDSGSFEVKTLCEKFPLQPIHDVRLQFRHVASAADRREDLMPEQ